MTSRVAKIVELALMQRKTDSSIIDQQKESSTSTPEVILSTESISIFYLLVFKILDKPTFVITNTDTPNPLELANEGFDNEISNIVNNETTAPIEVCTILPEHNDSESSILQEQLLPSLLESNDEEDTGEPLPSEFTHQIVGIKPTIGINNTSPALVKATISLYSDDKCITPYPTPCPSPEPCGQFCDGSFCLCQEIDIIDSVSYRVTVSSEELSTPSSVLSVNSPSLSLATSSSISSRKLTRGSTRNAHTRKVALEDCYDGFRPISLDKFKDLNQLCATGIIPQRYHNFYKNLNKNKKTPE
ncbi:unnamed protein product [Diabrotica balteata]|uniref:Uncharacterized protein n=1 Tax=Diabrotica balteata TaxID=107213 RepID=A0A9N9TG11_DIABA|nr:unnamed protein product [Diabrotica balteata]